MVIIPFVHSPRRRCDCEWNGCTRMFTVWRAAAVAVGLIIAHLLLEIVVAIGEIETISHPPKGL